MPPWQKRLADLAHLLSQCHSGYMEPELFRVSVNQFLQTARTVTFIIQKHKDSIPNFQVWYDQNVVAAWKHDQVMQWAKDARNTIEKEGDLDLNSSISVTLFYGYLEETDLSIQIEDPRLLRAGVQQLKRIAQKALPSGVSRTAAIKVDRRWVSASLPNRELLGAMCATYRSLHELCRTLAEHLGIELDAKIPDPSKFDDIASNTRQVRYFKLSSSGSFSMRTERRPFNPSELSPAVADEVRRISETLNERGVDATHRWLTAMAEMTFNRDGYHVPMAFLYDENWAATDMISFRPDDATDKYIIWRDIGDRIRANGAYGLSFIGEAWLRKAVNLRDQPISSQPIVGEELHVVLLDKTGAYRETRWTILRDNDTPTLARVDTPTVLFDKRPGFLAPVMAAWGVAELHLA